MTATDPWIIIVGAGPAGLLLALLLGRRGVSVRLLEKDELFENRPRATHYAGPAALVLHRAGVLEETRDRGLTLESIGWRTLDQTYLGGFSQTVFPQDDPALMVCLPLDRVVELLLEHIAKLPNVQVDYQHEVVEVGQDEQSAWVDVEVRSTQERQRLRAQYVAGCDGANSRVRRCLFGRSFPGFTWDQQIVATNTYFPFEKYGYEDGNFIIHPEHWHMTARITKYGLWRVTYGEKSGLTNDEIIARQPMKFEKFLPGNPKPTDNMYKVESISAYRVHQRLAERMRVGRVVLAADAAHLCNPFGGMGLTSGIVDVGGLYDCLMGIYENKADDSILDQYDEVRRAKYRELIDPISSANMKRLFAQDPETEAGQDEFLIMCRKAADDPEISRQLQRQMMALTHDFTQYYSCAASGRAS